jgi:hypothetical protein
MRGRRGWRRLRRWGWSYDAARAKRLDATILMGRLLPHEDDLEDAGNNPHTRAEMELVLQEMKRVKAQIDDFLAAARAAKA